MCSEVLGIPHIVITLVKEMGIVTNFPVKCQLCHSPLYWSFYATGPGHYDATTEMEFKDTKIEYCKYIFLIKIHCETNVETKRCFLMTNYNIKC